MESLVPYLFLPVQEWDNDRESNASIGHDIGTYSVQMCDGNKRLLCDEA